MTTLRSVFLRQRPFHPGPILSFTFFPHHRSHRVFEHLFFFFRDVTLPPRERLIFFPPRPTYVGVFIPRRVQGNEDTVSSELGPLCLTLAPNVLFFRLFFLHYFSSVPESGVCVWFLTGVFLSEGPNLFSEGGLLSLCKHSKCFLLPNPHHLCFH